MPVTGVAADAAALPGVLLVQHHPERHVEGLEAEAREVVGELLHPGLMADGGIGIRRAGRRVGGILSPPAVHVVELLGLRVVRLEVLVRDRPGRRGSTPVLELPEVLPAQPEERGAVELRVPADPVVRVRMELPALGIPPHFLRRVPPLQIDGLGAPVGLLTRDVVTPLDEQDALARRGQAVGESSTAGAGPHDDDVEVSLD